MKSRIKDKCQAHCQRWSRYKKSPEAARLTPIVYLMELKKQLTKTEICLSGKTSRGQTGGCKSWRDPDPKLHIPPWGYGSRRKWVIVPGGTCNGNPTRETSWAADNPEWWNLDPPKRSRLSRASQELPAENMHNVEVMDWNQWAGYWPSACLWGSTQKKLKTSRPDGRSRF